VITPPAPAVATAAPCPECASGLTEDTRFVQWCQACGWNANPGAKTATGRGDRFQRKLNRAAEERLHRRITETGAQRSGLDTATVGAYVFSALVHLVTLTVAVGGVLALLEPYWPLRIVGAVLVLLAFHLRPRFGPSRKAMKRRQLLAADDAPALRGLAARVAAELGTRPPDLIAVDAGFNATYTRVGMRRRVLLTLGLPLWETLGPEQRLALLGHELGHGVNGDARRGGWIGSALRSLEEWYRLLRPGRIMVRGGRGGNPGGGIAILGEMVARWAMVVFAELVLLAYRLLTRLTRLSGRRAEYLADGFGVRVAGVDATAGMLRALTLGGIVARFGERRRLRGASAGDYWSELHAYVVSVPESERARLLLLSRLDDSAVDTTHPPTHLRLAFVEQLPRTAPTVLLTAGESAAIDAELAPARAAVAQRLS